jgi:hypothetical protein
MLFVVILKCLDQLQSDGGFAGAFFAEDDGGAGIAAVSEDFIPCWMMDGFGAVMLEDVIRLGVFLAEGVDANAVMFEELLEFHGPGILGTKVLQQSAWVVQVTAAACIPHYSRNDEFAMRSRGERRIFPEE